MNPTTITIGFGEALTIILALVGGFAFVWRASAVAHKEIIGRLNGFENRLCNLEGDVKVVMNDLDWLKHHARTGKAPDSE